MPVVAAGSARLSKSFVASIASIARARCAATTDELELRYATAGALAGTTNRLYADCNSGFEVRYRSVPTVQSGCTITH